MSMKIVSRDEARTIKIDTTKLLGVSKVGSKIGSEKPRTKTATSGSR